MHTDFIPFHKPYITEDEISEVVETVKSGWWTTGPKAKKFEIQFGKYIGSKNSLAVSSWTAAAHLSLEAIGLKPGDEVIVPAFTFTATAEVVCYFGARPVIVDVDPVTCNLTPEGFEKAITNKTKAVIPVHFGGMPCDMDEIIKIARSKNIFVVEDAAHALPSYYRGKKIGIIGDVTCFSFYVTKTLATGEGGMICTNNDDIAKRCSIMKLHGIDNDSWDRYTEDGSWYYEVISPGYKYNFTDIQAALGLAQLKKIDEMYQLRKNIADKYDKGFSSNDLIRKSPKYGDRESSLHLYTIRLNLSLLGIGRSQFIKELKQSGIGTSVHFIPLYRHPFYRKTFSLDNACYPNSEKIYEEIISLPIWPGMTKMQIEKVIECVNEAAQRFKR